MNVHDSWVAAPVADEPGASGADRPLDADWPISATLVVYLVSTAAGLAFFAFLVRRRVDAARTPLQAAIAAIPPTAAPTGRAVTEAQAVGETRVTPLPPMRELVPPVDPDLLRDPAESNGPLPEEAGIPRWLRPSVRSARRERAEVPRDWR